MKARAFEIDAEVRSGIQMSWGYPLALGSMTLVAIGMFHFFRKGGWFGN